MKSDSSNKYIHGYLEQEQERLREQAIFAEGPVYDYIDFSDIIELLEIGSGVGAQTEILLRRFPHLKITGIEYEVRQILKAYENMARLGYGQDKVTFIQQDAKNLHLDKQYDAAFICWVLEHVPDPVKVLVSMKPFLKPGAIIYTTEVFNTTFYTYPVKTEIINYWNIYNNFQVEIGGDPQVGARLGDLFEEAGYRDIDLRSGGFHLDSRSPEEKRSIFSFWKKLMSSGAPALLEAGLVSEKQVMDMQHSMDELRDLPQSVFYYRFIQAKAYV